MTSREERIKARARVLGFDLVGIAAAEPSAFANEYRDWVARGFAGEMAYMTGGAERRLDPRSLLPGARSIIVVGMNYYTDSREGPGMPRLPGSGHGVFARYARGDDYHDVMSTRLKTLLDYVIELAGPGTTGRVYVDTGPVLEREVAHRAGLGWFGKNTMLINTRRGSYFLLGEIITNTALAPDVPAVGNCGTCTKCLDACPTGAIVAPYELDARRCISYLTIELKGEIPEDMRPFVAASGGRIFGCDICQEVCPFNERRAAPTREAAFRARRATRNARAADFLYLTDEEFRERFRRSPVKRAKRLGLLRNAASALAGTRSPRERAALKHAATSDPDELVRAHAQWALDYADPDASFPVGQPLPARRARGARSRPRP